MMNLQQKKLTLIEYLKMKVSEGDWHGVSDAANDLREIEVALKLGSRVMAENYPVKPDKEVPLQAIPPVEMPIPHNANEVLGLLKLSDEQLVEKMFPDFSKPQTHTEA